MNAFKGLLEPYARITCTCGSEGSGAQQCAPLTRLVSPVLSNIYLDKLDEFVERELIPQYTRGACRAANPSYRHIDSLLRRAWRRGDRAEARRLARQMRTLPSTDPMDPCTCREPRPCHATRRYSLIMPSTRVSLRRRYWSRSTGSGSGFSGAAASRERWGRC
jgi:hypothetical protein